jgi:putative aldouronate transport system substrate-binding protein
MKKKKLGLAVLMVVVLIGSLLAGCGSNKTNESAASPSASDSNAVNTDPAKEAEKPVLKVLIPYQAFDPNTDASAKRIQEVTGFTIDYHLLPKDNADQQLLLELASGEDYDIVRVTSVQFAALMGKGALQELDDLIAKDGSDIQKAVSDMGWKSATSGGKKYGVPIEGDGDINDPYGLIQGGIGVRTDILSELKMKVPTTIDEFYNYLKAVKDTKGIIPLTGSGADGFNAFIGSAFGLGTSPWYDVSGQLVPRVKMPGYIDYITFMNKLYQEGLIDKDFPVNKLENTQQKFNSGQAAALAPAMFWDIPALLPALKENNPAAALEMITPLVGQSGVPYFSQMMKADRYQAIPKNSKHAEAAMQFINALANPDIFLSTYLGEEGTHFEMIDGQYFPILPAFDELKNSKQFTGAAPAGLAYQMWQARARKTPEMAEAFEKLNSNIQKEWFHVNYTGYATSLSEVQQYEAALNNMEKDFLIKSMVEKKELKKIYDDFVSEYDKQGGSTLTAAMNTWYAANK